MGGWVGVWDGWVGVVGGYGYVYMAYKIFIRKLILLFIWFVKLLLYKTHALPD